MSDTKHTPGPWSLGVIDDTIVDNHQLIASAFGNKANAERIVACVNFCEGTPNELLLGPSLDTINRDLDRLLKLVERKNIELMDSYSLIGQYRYQRDELFKATTNFVRSYGSDHTKEMRAARALVKRHDHSKDPMMEALEQILKDSAELPHIHEIARKALEKGGAL